MIVLRRRLCVPRAKVVFGFRAYEGEIERDKWGRIRNQLLWEERATNLIVTSGKDKLMNQLFGKTTSPVNSMGVGTDSTAAAVGQTKLNPSVAGSVSLLAFDAGFPTYASPTMTAQTTWGTGAGNFQWNEAGMFDGTSNGTSLMFDRVVFGPFTKTTATSIIVSATTTQS